MLIKIQFFDKSEDYFDYFEKTKEYYDKYNNTWIIKKLNIDDIQYITLCKLTIKHDDFEIKMIKSKKIIDNIKSFHSLLDKRDRKLTNMIETLMG